MHQRTRFFFWVILLLVGLSFVAPDQVAESLAPAQDSPVALIDSDDVDDPDHSRPFALIAHTQLSLLPFGIFFPGLVQFGQLQPPTQSTSPRFLLLSLRTPRSPTAS